MPAAAGGSKQFFNLKLDGSNPLRPAIKSICQKFTCSVCTIVQTLFALE
jgi:hypothetical protein